ncbi:TorF family putative porin [Steroidobacter cummioxidans]|uniref:TorF family putative porin n=1 Tax=Steroidobacter cummioxidans TaxID=1803913 RepID=UPI001379A3F8|nr:TorF family putative porin [Steroidobacter cummioxidans]
MRHFRILAALGMLGAATAANAGVSSTWTLASDYDFRGITQSAQDPAIQGSIDYAANSGWYVGAWGSNVDFGPGVGVDLEVDVYTGFSGQSEGGLGYDVGLVYYTYPDESDYNYFEAYGSISKDWFKGKLWYSNDFGGKSTSGSTPAFYAEANGAFPLPKNFTLQAHAGYSFGDYWSNSNSEYFDYSLGVGYTAGNFSLGLKWVDGSDLKSSDGTPGDVFSSESRVVFTVATTFPWSNN